MSIWGNCARKTCAIVSEIWKADGSANEDKCRSGPQQIKFSTASTRVARLTRCERADRAETFLRVGQVGSHYIQDKGK